MEKIREIKQKEVVFLGGRLYKVSEGEISNGEHRAKRPHLILLREKELTELLNKALVKVGDK